MKLETENKKKTKETKASFFWERTSPRQPWARKAGWRAPSTPGGRVAVQCHTVRVPLVHSALPTASSSSWAALAPVSAEVVVFRAPAQRHNDSISGWLAQLGLGRVPRWPLSWEVNTERCRGDRPWDRGVTEGRVPRLGSGLKREQSRPRVAGSPAEALSPVTMTVGAEWQEEPAVRGASSLQRGSQSDRK